ncbi:MAG: hypothetical protein L0Z62_19195 [Gemmataceae bacterium]|nr:hypothetical protein [Gemmataceae bacterium]
MLDYRQVRALIHGILNADNATKQGLGRRFAAYLGFTPGPGGPDDGIDGLLEHEGHRTHFQCKLRSTPLDRDDARLLYSDLKYHRVQVSILLAGVGFKDTFRERLFGHPDIDTVRIHLLTLADLFEETASFKAALQDLPLLAGLSEVAAQPL